jgi:hypothetical protein
MRYHLIISKFWFTNSKAWQLIKHLWIRIIIVYLIKRPSRGKYNYELYVQDSDLKNDKFKGTYLQTQVLEVEIWHVKISFGKFVKSHWGTRSFLQIPVAMKWGRILLIFFKTVRRAQQIFSCPEKTETLVPRSNLKISEPLKDGPLQMSQPQICHNLRFVNCAQSWQIVHNIPAEDIRYTSRPLAKSTSLDRGLKQECCNQVPYWPEQNLVYPNYHHHHVSVVYSNNSHEE